MSARSGQHQKDVNTYVTDAAHATVGDRMDSTTASVTGKPEGAVEHVRTYTVVTAPPRAQGREMGTGNESEHDQIDPRHYKCRSGVNDDRRKLASKSEVGAGWINGDRGGTLCTRIGVRTTVPRSSNPTINIAYIQWACNQDDDPSGLQRQPCEVELGTATSRHRHCIRKSRCKSSHETTRKRPIRHIPWTNKSV